MEKRDRYSRQIRFRGIGEAGQQRITQASVAVVGLGALGSVAADYLARAGVGRLRVIDRDLVELTNLQRQVLFDEKDAREGLPKAVAAARRLRAVNSDITVESVVADLTAAGIDGHLSGMNLIVDGTDNFETRFLINEWSVRERIPWVYGAAVGSYGLTLPVLPGSGPCLVCVFENAPPPDMSPTCDTAGIVGPVAGAVASLQATAALRLLAAPGEETVRPQLLAIDPWLGTTQQVSVTRRPEGCRVCGASDFPHLDGRAGASAIRLCGRNAVQVSASSGSPVDLDSLARRLATAGPVRKNAYLVRAQVEDYDLAVFADGRSLVFGTDDPAVARSVVSRYVGA